MAAHAVCRRIGPALLFERLWQEIGCRAVLDELTAQRQFGFAAERAVFLTMLHRLLVSGSDRAAETWRADYRIDGAEELQLHHLYRTMAWLGEPFTDQASPAGATCLPSSAWCSCVHGYHQPVLCDPHAGDLYVWEPGHE